MPEINLVCFLRGASMRIAVLFDLKDSKAGGAFSFNYSLYKYILEHKLELPHEFVTVFSQNTDSNYFPDIALPSKFTYRFYFSLKFFTSFWRIDLIRHRLLLNSCRAFFLDSKFKKHKIDAVWAVQPLSINLHVPYLTTSWDISHAITPYFHEVSKFGVERSKRDVICRRIFSGAFRIVVGTDQGKQEIAMAYGVNFERILVNPFPTNSEPSRKNLVRDKTKFLYPANFWPHKNHALLLKSFAEAVHKSNLPLRLVLTGSDKGTLSDMKELVHQLSIDDNVEFAGFISKDELEYYYWTANAVIFPSLIGPDNLPPLEALGYGCRILVADIPGAFDQFGHFASYFDPYNQEKLSACIIDHLESFDLNSRINPDLDVFLASRSTEKYVTNICREFDKIRHIVRYL